MEIQWSLVLFTALSGAGAWLFACIGIDEFRGLAKKVPFVGSLMAVVLLGVGGIASVMHLSHPERMLEALNHPTSGIFIEAVLLGSLALVALVYAVLIKRESSPGARKILSAVGIVLAIAFSFSCGKSYMMSAHETWNTLALPLGYLGTAAVSGTTIYLLLCVAYKEGKKAIDASGKETMAAAVIALILSLAYGIASGAAFGEHALIFWGLVAACGCILPFILGLLVGRKPESAITFAVFAVVGALVGSLAYRVLMWLVASQLMALFDVVIGH